MNKSLQILMIYLLAILSQSCTHALLTVERTENYLYHTQKIEKIVTIDPDFKKYTKKRPSLKKMERNLNKEAQISTVLKNNARLAKIDLEIVDANDLGSDRGLVYLNFLAPLKKDIFISNFYQDVPKSTDRYRIFAAKRRTLSASPIFSSEYSHLSQKFGTPFFAIHGVFCAEKSKSVLFYTILVNVNTAEVLYRELRVVGGKPTMDNLNPIVYDSFNIMRKGMKK